MLCKGYLLEATDKALARVLVVQLLTNKAAQVTIPGLEVVEGVPGYCSHLNILFNVNTY